MSIIRRRRRRSENSASFQGLENGWLGLHFLGKRLASSGGHFPTHDYLLYIAFGTQLAVFTLLFTLYRASPSREARSALRGVRSETRLDARDITILHRIGCTACPRESCHVCSSRERATTTRCVVPTSVEDDGRSVDKLGSTPAPGRGSRRPPLPARTRVETYCTRGGDTVGLLPGSSHVSRTHSPQCMRSLPSVRYRTPFSRPSPRHVAARRRDAAGACSTQRVQVQPRAHES